MAKEKDTSVERSKMLNKLRKRSKGAFDKIKKTEAKAGGRKLPGGLEDAVGQTTSAKLDADKNGDPYVYVYASVLEPTELAGVPCGKYYKLAEDQYNTAEQNLEAFFNDMKLIGFSEIIESAGDESEATDNILKVLEKEKVKFVFNTSTRPNKNGEYKTFFQESDVNDDDDEEEEEEDEEEEERKPAKKSRPAPKSKNEKSVPFKVGDKVKTTGNFFEDGNEYQGIVNEIDEDEENCAIFFEEDDDQQDIPWGNLAIIAEKKSRGKAKKEAEDDIPFEVGDTVRTTGDYFEDGVIYEGTVQEMDDENAKVEFEDETCEVPLENLELAN